ncbi:MAG: alpha/beta fold hydrolase [Pseudomonadota bacterium]|nr:alpha/beta fold hydrolase [Pseudomonadota bacterium]
MNAVIIEPPQKVTTSILWLHGLGANGHDFEPIVAELPAELTAHTRFIFPHAPTRPITINGGMHMPGWYDVVATDLTQHQDIQGIHDSAQLIQNYLDSEIKHGIPSERIILAGFSQGGALALHVGLRYPTQLAGIIALSTYLPLATTLAAESHAANRPTPIFMAHGQFDPIILFTQAEHSHYQLNQLGYSVEWHYYPMAHSVSLEEINDLSRWLMNLNL